MLIPMDRFKEHYVSGNRNKRYVSVVAVGWRGRRVERAELAGGGAVAR